MEKDEDTDHKKAAPVKPDPTRIIFRRGERKDAVSDKRLFDVKPPRNTGPRVKLPKCVSMWKNPTSKVVSLEARMIHDRFKDIQHEVNTEMFLGLKSSLDEAERSCSQSTGEKSIRGEDKSADTREVLEK